MLELKNVTKRYGRKVVLDDVSIEFKKGYITCLLGLNGVGKSTTMKSIMRLIPINKGEILVDGEKITQKNINKIAYTICPNFGFCKTYTIEAIENNICIK